MRVIYVLLTKTIDIAVKYNNKNKHRSEYTMFRPDRSTPGGGVLAYVHQSTPVSRSTTAEVDDKEVLWLLLTPPRTPRPFNSIIDPIVYFSPGQSADCGIDMIEYLI